MNNNIQALEKIIEAKDKDIATLTHMLEETLEHVTDLKHNFAQNIAHADMYTLASDKLKELEQSCDYDIDALTPELNSILMILHKHVDQVFVAAKKTLPSRLSDIHHDSIRITQQSGILHRYANEIKKVRDDETLDPEDQSELIENLKRLRDSEVIQLEGVKA